MRSLVGALVSALLPISGILAGAASSSATEPSCVQVTWQAVASDCAWTYAEYVEASTSQTERTWVITLQCGNGGICTEHIECVENGEEGFMHDVYMDGTDVGDVCAPADEIQEVDIVKLVIREFKRMGWPASELVVQPRGGKTLVNFKTNFYTPDNRLIDRSVTVAGRQVEIRAIPISYTWFFGDGESTTTATPGSPHPNLEITHEYARVGEVVVQVDTTYAGEYRIGNGEWISIQETLTVAGEPQDLAIVEALPQLVLE